MILLRNFTTRREPLYPSLFCVSETSFVRRVLLRTHSAFQTSALGRLRLPSLEKVPEGLQIAFRLLGVGHMGARFKDYHLGVKNGKGWALSVFW